MLSSKMYVYGIAKNRLEIYFELSMIVTQPSVFQELDFIIFYKRGRVMIF